MLGWNVSDPQKRGRQSGCAGRFLGESLAETPIGVTKVIENWLGQRQTRTVLPDSEAFEVGIAGLHDHNGILRLDLVVGA
jgi:hypothetical protein